MATARQIEANRRNAAGPHQMSEPGKQAIRGNAIRHGLATRIHLVLPGEDQSGPLFLNTLLEAQSKATKAESDFASSKLTYSLSLMNLKKAMGTLLKHEMIRELRTHDGVIPQIILDKQSSTTETIELQPTALEPESELDPE